MKVLFATTNLAKIKKYKKALEENGIELITISDLDFKLNIEENGKNAIENAYIKAKTYYDATQIPTVGIDNCLFIEGLPEEKQPGTHVRRVNGKETKECSWSKSDFYLVDKPCQKRTPGYPLDSITIMPESNQYLVELTEEQRKVSKKESGKNGDIEFIINNI